MNQTEPKELSPEALEAIYESAEETSYKSSYVKNTYQKQMVLDAEKYDGLRGHIAYLEKQNEEQAKTIDHLCRQNDILRGNQ